MVQYKLHYFDVRGYAETARLLFHYGNIEFEDIRFSKEEWNKGKKAESLTGKAPWLEVDGKILPESAAINRFLAKKVGLAGKDEWEEAQIDAIFDFYRDCLNECMQYFMVAMGLAEGDKDKLHDEVFVPHVSKILNYLITCLEKNPNGFLMPSGLTWIDFFCAENLQTYQEWLGDELKQKFPKLAEYKERVYAVPQIKAYVEGRKASKN